MAITRYALAHKTSLPFRWLIEERVFHRGLLYTLPARWRCVWASTRKAALRKALAP